LLERAWRLRGAVTFYDALYVALAERLGLPLITLDARLAGAAPARVVVDLIA
jgi:predicted nucleic acid-binding protein